VPSCTTAGQTICGSACADLTRDPANCGACGHSCAFAGATCSAGKCTAAAIATGQTSPNFLTTDANSVFWINETATPQITAANKNGTAFTNGLPGVSPLTPGFVLFGSGTSEYIYWIDAETTVWFYGPIGSVLHDMPLASVPSGAAVDVVGGPNTMMYWTNADVAGIQAIGNDGIDQVFSPPFYGASIPVAIATDGTRLYWSDVVGPPGTSKVSAGPLASGTGPGPGPVATLGTGLSVSGNPRTLAVNATNVYVISNSSVVQIPLPSGGSSTVLATGNPISLAADASGVYWVDGTAGTVLSVAVGTTKVVTLATGQSIVNTPGNVAVDSLGVYWATSTGVMALAK
jgi:hypothetical protein